MYFDLLRGSLRWLSALLALGLVCGWSTAPAFAGTIAWTDWTAINVNNPGGSAQGTLSVPSQPTVAITYSGDVESPSQTSNPANFNYWLPT